MKYQVLFSLKNNEKIFKTVVCCSCDLAPKGLSIKLYTYLKMDIYIELTGHKDSRLPYLSGYKTGFFPSSMTSNN